jgi:hypothetical protein
LELDQADIIRQGSLYIAFAELLLDFFQQVFNDLCLALFFSSSFLTPEA